MKFKIKKDNLIEELLSLKFVQYDRGIQLFETRNNVTTKENNIINMLQSNRRADLRGLDLYDTKDIAILGKMCRDMRYETTRFIYVKDNIIVGADTTTTGLPTTSFTMLKFNTSDGDDKNQNSVMMKTLDHIFKKIDRLNADSVYLLHNHPSGNPQFSDSDRKTFTIFSSIIPEMEDAIVVGINTISFLVANKTIKFDDIDAIKNNIGPSFQYSEDMAAQIKHYLTDKNYSLLIYVSASQNILNIDEIKNTEFNDIMTMGRYLANKKKEFGAPQLYLYTEDLELFRDVGALDKLNLIEHSILTDAFYYSEANNEIVSLEGNFNTFRAKGYTEFGKPFSFKTSVKG